MEQSTKETLEKLSYLAIGLFSPENGQFSDLVNSWIEKGKMTEEEGRKFLSEITEKAKTVRTDIENKIRSESEQFYKNIHIATTDQIENLEKKVAKLEHRIKLLEKNNS